MEPLLQTFIILTTATRKKRWTKFFFCNFSHSLCYRPVVVHEYCVRAHTWWCRDEINFWHLFFIFHTREKKKKLFVVVTVCGRKWNLEWFMFNCFVDNFFLLQLTSHNGPSSLKNYCVKLMMNRTIHVEMDDMDDRFLMIRDHILLKKRFSFHFSIVIKESLLNGYWYGEWRP